MDISAMAGTCVSVEMTLGEACVSITHDEASGSPEFTETLLALATRYALKANLVLQGFAPVEDDADVMRELERSLASTSTVEGVQALIASSQDDEEDDR